MWVLKQKQKKKKIFTNWRKNISWQNEGRDLYADKINGFFLKNSVSQHVMANIS